MSKIYANSKRMRALQNTVEVIKKHGLPGIRFLFLQKLNKLNFLKGVVSFKFPGIRHRIYLRAQTSDFKLFRNIFIEEEYDIDLPFTPKTIIDGGANIGLAAIVFANKYPDAKIVCIEPESSNYNLLQKNIAAYKNIHSIKAGIWHNSSFLNIINPQAGKWAFTIHETDHPDENSLKGISVPDIIRECGWENADLIKLDIEGSEKEVFENNPYSWLGNAKGVIIELHDWIKSGCSKAVYTAINMYDFDNTSKGENTVFIHR